MDCADRLTTLLERFRLRIAPATLEDAHLAAFRCGETGDIRLILQPGAPGITAYVAPCFDADIAPQSLHAELLFALRVDFASAANPLLTALPVRVVEQVAPGAALGNLIALLATEYGAPRCGSPIVMARLGEVLMVQLLRARIENGATTPGLLAGLADPRISAALVAIHDAPDRPWRNADLADVAGLSASRFKELFAATVGATPAGYLRRWRLTLARRDLQQGDRVDRVAQRYGYRAPDAFSRAFLREYGERPRQAARAAG